MLCNLFCNTISEMRCGKLPIFYLEIHGHPWENRWSITSFCSNSAEMGTFTCLPLFFVPFLCRCSLTDDIRHEGACLKKLKSFRESRRCLALKRRSWHSTIVPTYSTIVPTYSTIVPTFEQKCLAKKWTAASWLCETPLSYRYQKTAVFFCRWRRGDLFGICYRIFQNLAKRRASVYVMYAQNPGIHDASAVFSESR